MIQPQYNPAYAQMAPATGASAVNIQIFEPKAYSAPATATPSMTPVTAPMYQYPQASMYAPGMPTSPYQQYMQPPMAPYGYAPTSQAPVAYAPEPQVMPQTAMTPEAAPAPEAAATPKVETPAAPEASAVDVAALNQALISEDPNQQTEAITKVAQMSQGEPAVALQLVDNQVMQNLAGIIQKDTSALAGPTPEQIAAIQKLEKGEQLTPDEQKLTEQGSPKQIAEKNKIFSMFTLAMLQKLQRDEVAQFNAQAGNGASPVPQLKIEELIGYNEIANAITTSPIPAVKVAGIQALSYVAQPEDSAAIQQILTPLTNDTDADVKQAAQEALTKLTAAPQQDVQAKAPTEAPAPQQPAASTQG